MNGSSRRRHSGFTLVEMLVVIAIIAILAAIILPAIGAARRRGLVTSISMELTQITSALEAYKTKYGDYPPLFIDTNPAGPELVERHIRKAWPNATEQEIQGVLAVFYNTTTGGSNVDPAEALVFWLGGFSEDPRSPFFGKGGPLVIKDPTQPVNDVSDVRMNEERNAGPLTFDEKRLTMNFDNTLGYRVSTDELELHGIPVATFNDPFPVYIPKGTKQPYVYFDARAYEAYDSTSQTFPLAPSYPPADAAYANTSIRGVARPYLENKRRTPTTPNPLPFEWAGEVPYQVIACGLDNTYGADANPNSSNHLFKVYPTGDVIEVDLSNGTFTVVDNYTTAQGVAPTGDSENITSFSEGKELKDKKP